MPEAVELRVRVAGSQGVEFALRRSGAGPWRSADALAGLGLALALTLAGFWLWEARSAAAVSLFALGAALALVLVVRGFKVVEGERRVGADGMQAN